MKPVSHLYVQYLYKFLTFSIVFSLLWSASGLSASAKDAQYTAYPQKQNDIYAQCLNSGLAMSAVESNTGTLRFVGTSKSKPIPQPVTLPANASPEAAARGYLSVCGSLFGLRNQASELTLSKQQIDNNRSTVRFQQEYQGIPVIGGEVIIQVDGNNNIAAISKEILPEVRVSTQATINAAQAEEKALQSVAKKYQLDVSDLTVTEPELWIYNPQLIGPEDGDTLLVWRMVVQPVALIPIREFILVDAQRGNLALSFNQVNMAKDRETYSAENLETLPGTLVCDESNPTCSGGDTDAVSAHLFAGDVYDFYSNNHGRDSIDNAGMTMVSTVHYSVAYYDSFWNGTQVVFGDGRYVVDDIAAHEWTHGVTEYESGLFNYYQSGAISEAFSDLWGEFVDLSNGRGTDTPEVRWLIGEDLSTGAIRDMENPTAFGSPDRMKSSSYYLGTDDNGGVHINSGVNNKAVYLMTDGGSFNGQTVTGLGITKVATIYYEAQTNLLTSGADYADLHEALYQACQNKIGTAGITSGDCEEVRKATLAVEMNEEPVVDYNPEVPLCSGIDVPYNVFFDDMEYGTGNWAFNALTGTNRWTQSSEFAHSGQYSLYADDNLVELTGTDTYAAMKNSVTLPTNAHLHFHHAYGFDDYDDFAYDGGVLEYSTNGGVSWSDAGSLFDENGYTGVIETGYGNPLAGRSAFVEDSHGYISSRLNLSILGGENVRFRWRMGLDDSTYDWGWWLDDVQIYTCGDPTLAPGTITDLVATTGTVDGTVDLSWTAVGDDGYAGTATSYLVRYSQTPITNETIWTGATIFSNAMTPKTAGESESLTVTGLIPGETYYFAVRARDSYLFIGGVSNSPGAMAFGSLDPGGGVYDDAHTRWEFSEGWTTVSTGGAYDGAYRHASATDAWASFPFYGDGFVLYYTARSLAGQMDVYVDDVQVGTIDEYSATQIFQSRWDSPEQTNGYHTVEFIKKSGTYVNVDAIQILSSDGVPPAAITLTAETGSMNGTVGLDWTAVGDDGTDGTATAYLVRYSESAIDSQAAWNAATPVTSGVPVPQVAGSAESMTVSGLTPNGTYYFAVRAQDDGGDLGDLSNSPSAVAFEVSALSSGIYDDTHANWVYSAGWIRAATPGPYENGYHYTATNTRSATFSFYGSMFVLYYTAIKNRGLLAVYVDDVLIDTINQYSLTKTFQTKWNSPPLGDGNHTVKFVKTGGSYAEIDAIQILSPDGVPPAAIADLAAASGTTDGTVDLSWTAVGDDNYNGTASAYLVRYSESAIDSQAAWDAATPVTSGVPVPQEASILESMTVSGLTPNETYYFAVRAQDDGGDLGDLVNSPSAVAYLTPPPGSGIYDDTHANWVYSAGWIRAATPGPYENGYHYTATNTRSASFTFDGGMFVLYYTAIKNRGLLAVYVDDVLIDTINQYSLTKTFQTKWSSPPLGNDYHTVRFVKTGGAYVEIDAIQILSPDGVPPAAINDLEAASGTTDGAVDLDWTAVGDDGNDGAAMAYLVRYSESAIDSQAAWDAATPVTSGVPVPQVAGSAESMTVSGLTPNGTYYFAVRAQDDGGDLGDLSNSPSATAYMTPPPASGIYDDTHPNWVYSVGWIRAATPGPYENGYRYTATNTRSATFTFDGGMFVLYYTAISNRGLLDVYVDDVLIDTINQYSAVKTFQTKWPSPLLEDKYHTVKFVKKGGLYVEIDAIQILSPDGVPPAAITDLAAASGTTDGTVDLDWTAVGDDGTDGAASAYLVRYSESAIDSQAAWDAATPVTSGVPVPQAAGSAESMTVSGLTPNGTYYFAVRAQDDGADLGGLSNSPSAVAYLTPPPGSGIYDDTHPNWVYSAGWIRAATPGPYEDGYHYTATNTRSASFTFDGGMFVLYYTAISNRGLLAVYVDDVLIDTINQYSAVKTFQTKWPSPPLGDDYHTVRFVKTGGSYAEIDAIQILSPDGVPPAAINDLAAASGTTDGTVDLDWTAVGDDGNDGAAMAYLVRYSESAIDSQAAWDAATPVTSGVPVPQAAGFAESMTVSGLTPNGTYYFAVRAQDDGADLGDLSNSPSAKAYMSPPPGSGIYDDTHDNWTYSTGWIGTTVVGAYEDGYHYTAANGNWASFAFDGDTFTLYYTATTNRGQVEVYVDDVLIDTINQYSPTRVFQSTWPSPSLGDDYHTVRFVKISGSYVDIDAIEVSD